MRKGITPIISIIILLLITVALAGAAWSFLQGFLYPQIQKTFLVPTGGSFCSKVAGFNTIKVYVLNVGYQSGIGSTDFIIKQIDGNDVLIDTSFPISLATGSSALAINNNNGGAGWSSGYHTLDLGTQSSVQHLSVFCP